MPTLSDDEIIGAVNSRYRQDTAFARRIDAAIEHKDRSWIWDLALEAVRLVFGEVVHAVAGPVIDWVLRVLRGRR